MEIASLMTKLQRFCWMGGFCLLVELHQEGSAPAACAADLFLDLPEIGLVVLIPEDKRLQFGYYTIHGEVVEIS